MAQPIRSKTGAMVTFAVAAALVAGAVAWGVRAYYVDRNAVVLRDDLELVGFVLLIAGSTFAAARQMMMPSAEEVLARDLRPPVVYLRPFDEDQRRVTNLPVGRRIGGKPVFMASGPGSRERQMAPALRHLGPFVAVGAPGDTLAPLGAARLYLADDEWREKVEALVRRAAAIVLVPETSAGTVWEVTKVARWVDPRRVLIVVPNPALRPLGYDRIRRLTAEYLPAPLPENCAAADAFMFDASGKPTAVGFKRGSAATLGTFIAQVQALPVAGSEVKL